MSSKQRRQGVRMCVKREVDKIQPILNNAAPMNLAQLQLSVSKLTSYRTDLQGYDSAVLSEMTEDSKIEAEISATADYNDSILDNIGRANIMILTAISQTQHDAASSSQTSGPKKHNLRLPKLELGSFSGDPLEFQSFWDSFESSVHKNESLSPIDKFNYLKGLLAGDALKAVEGYRLTAANYEAVIETLKERFGDKQVAIFGHFEAMLALSPSSHEVGSLQTVADSCERHIRSLVALGLDESTFGQVFTPIMLSKLPKYVKIELHRKNGSQVWSLSHLREWLKDEIRAREMGERCFGEGRSTAQSDNNANGSSKSKGQTDTGRSERFQAKRQSSAAALVSNADRDDKFGSRSSTARKGASALVSSTTPNQVTCAYCGDGHYSDACAKFPDTKSRLSIVKNRCYCCLGAGHQSTKCRRKVPCVYCRRSGHHRSLCFKKFGPPEDSNDVGLNVAADPVNTSVRDKSSKSKRTIMQTATANLISEKSGKSVWARLLFDTAGSRTFITDRKCQELQLPVVDHEMVSIAGFQSTKRRTAKYNIVEFDVKCENGTLQRVTASVVPTITCPIQKIPIDVNRYPVLKNVTLADPLIDRPEFVDIDVLVGLDYYYDFVTGDRIQCPGGPLLLASRLGYITTGRIFTTATGPETIAVMLLNGNRTLIPERDSKVDIERYWDLEDVGMKEPPNQLTGDDDALLSHSKSLQQSEDGRYVSRWPWKCENPVLPDNFDLAHGRLTSLLKRFARNPDVFDAYQKIITDQLKNSVIEEAPQDPTGPNVYYMPHHCVVTPTKTTTKVRVVYDASSKSKKDVSSLNDCLHRGPVLLEDLCGLLMRFRLQQIALVSDIEKAFLQIGLDVNERDVTRFLWVNVPAEPPVGSNLIIYRFCRIPFGVISSPFVLENTMCQHLLRTGGDVAMKILKDHYVDNVITGETDIESATAHYHEAKKIFSSARMNLREWYSNSAELRGVFQETDKGKDAEPKVLGLRWDCVSDTLRCDSIKPSSGRTVTKREVLKSVSQLFDPLGIFAPVTVMGKMLIQELWKCGHNWDDALPEEMCKRWNKIFGCLQDIPVSGIPRFIGLVGDGSCDLHVFCDASLKACAAVVYLVKHHQDKTSSSDVLIAKTRLSPVKSTQTIPRLELVAVVLGVRLFKFAEEQIRIPVCGKYLWTDSQCTLHWLKRERVSARFVENRLCEVRKHSDVEFRFVSSGDNPADLPSRGCDAATLRASEIWWKGPRWLRGPKDDWPSNVLESGDPEADEVAAVAGETQPRTDVIDEHRFSSLIRLLRTTAYVLRFVSNARKPAGERISGRISVSEVEQARLWWHLKVQATYFSELVNQKDSTWPRGIGQQLGLFKDNDGILRCSGRISNASVPYDAKYPVLLPKDAHFTKLAILACHVRQLHSGVGQTLSDLRLAYWVVRGRSVVRRIIASCQQCRRTEGGPYRVPSAPSLPLERVTESPPFSHTGLDYLGPLFVKNRDQSTRKVWVCLYTCMVVRAIFLDVVEDLSAEQFLMSLRRFIASHGCPKYILSDNARQFHASDRALQKMWLDVLNSGLIQDFTVNKGIKWEFVVEFAPWMGGFYERLVGIVKRALKKTLHCVLATPVELTTILFEIASVVNARPLIYVENEIGQLPLTPAHFFGKSNSVIISSPEMEEEYIAQASTTHVLTIKWKRLQSVLENFWSAWRSQYLLSLRERDVSHKQRNCSILAPCVNTVVHIKDNGPRVQWKLARIVGLHPSRDGQIRSVTLRLKNGKNLRRPVKLLFPLEVGVDDASPGDVKSHGTDDSIKEHRPKRLAAVNAAKRIAETVSEDDDA